MTIRYAEMDDYEWLCVNDQHISRNILKTKIQNKEIIVATNNQIIAWLRYNLFWDNIPFMNLLFVIDPFRNQGIGKAILAFWEKEMRNLGYATVLTSTLSNECAQLFYRKVGYTDIGGFILPKEPLELMLMKNIE